MELGYILDLKLVQTIRDGLDIFLVPF